ncbi:MAG: lantibiotic dehydratase [Bacteroidota bacterium]
MNTHTFHNQLILRTPLKQTETNITWQKIQTCFQEPLVREALFIASPALHQQLERYEQQPEVFSKVEVSSLQTSLYKYYARFSNRCTPFGLFATVATLQLDKETNIAIEGSRIRKASKFDTFFLAQLLQFIERVPEIRAQLIYYPNTSLYTIGDKYRYVEYYLKGEQRRHKISGVDSNHYLEEVVKLTENGATLEQLIATLADEEVTATQIHNFLHTLIDNQFLVSELDLTLTGEDYLERLIAVFEETRFQFHEGQTILKLLRALQQQLSAIEAKEVSDVQDYLNLFAFIEQQFDKAQLNKLFQVDTFRDLSDATLSHRYLKQLRQAVQVINQLSSKSPQQKLETFKQRFQERYEAYEMPLVQVLDPDVGIGYDRSIGAKTPLVEGLTLSRNRSQSTQINWSKQQSFLFQKVMTAYAENATEIQLTEQELKPFKADESAYSDTFSVFFSAFSEANQEKIFVKNLWGPSANNLIGRFTHLDESIEKLADDIAQQEADLHIHQIVAEIVHLPQARVGNVLHRKSTRWYEIPYLGQSSLPREQQINVTDLMISVRHGRIVLRSKSLNKEVLPKLSNAHNYPVDALPIYHFLCDLQLQDQSPLGFSLGYFEYELPFVPRISIGDIVLSRAKWNLRGEEIKALLKNQNDTDHLAQFLQQRNIPKVVVVSRGDNEVLINFENPLSVQVFYSLIKNKGLIELKEFLFQESSITGNYANEFVASAYRKQAVENGQTLVANTSSVEDKKVQQLFSVGDEWLYYKFYCGDKIADTVLEQAIAPIVADLEAQQWIDKWFFIRYSDKDGFHLRFRIHLINKAYFTNCINSIKYHIQPLEQQGIVWKTQIDPYLRETERYGYASIEATESLFHADSQCTLQFSSLIEGAKGEEVRWLFAMLSIDQLLNDFGYSLKEKLSILKLLKVSFGKEFNRKGLLNKQINERYKNYEPTIERFLNEENKAAIYQPLWGLLKQRSEHLVSIIDELKRLDSQQQLPSPLAVGIVPSYIHMICNRIFLSKHRMQEMVAYDFLFKYYNKWLHTQKAALSKS